MTDKVVLTGGDGFLGWHTRCALLESGRESIHVPVGVLFNLERALQATDGASRFIHLAGVNRGPEQEVRSGNVMFAEQAARVLREVERPPQVVVYANSIQAGLDNTYGQAKVKAGAILAAACADVGAQFVDLRFPNLFGEHGVPFYNSVTATFCHILASGGTPEIQEDRELSLLHAQDAADVLVGNCEADQIEERATLQRVSELLERLTVMAELYQRGEIPDVCTSFARNLFNTYRSYVAARRSTIQLQRSTDARGSFSEAVRSRGGGGQASYSTTHPGVTRGNHFHRRKIERFVVMAGHAKLMLRRCLTNETVEYEVDGDHPVAVDMPTMWAHNITNIGTTPLYTAFWTNDLFNPACPDTIAEVV
ncbi:MAG: hypothetical protein LBV00_04300 [Propionibacteriaceae bacterium]|jgi:UDP-2-acetamido-2,6-beta-L-arabino-hexul-4-ose reductase|nr:hypothetical protein [Propionibacteriaceae bacterium]